MNAQEDWGPVKTKGGGTATPHLHQFVQMKFEEEKTFFLWLLWLSLWLFMALQQAAVIYIKVPNSPKMFLPDFFLELNPYLPPGTHDRTDVTSTGSQTQFLSVSSVVVTNALS